MSKGGAQLRIEVTDPGHVGVCRRAAQGLAEAWRFDATSAGRVGIVATELATNIIRHSNHGELLIQPVTEEFGTQIELLAVDRGRGMTAVEDCLRDGYSTGGTSGSGLGAVRRMSEAFDIYSQPGVGTIVMARIAAADLSFHTRRLRAPSHVQFGMISVPLRGETECGDIWSIALQPGSCSVLVADGLGHGPLAAIAAGAAATAYGERPFDNPQETLRFLHGRLSATRGAAVACALFDEQTSRVQYAGVGNISGYVVSAGVQKGMLSHNGTLGLSMARAQALPYDWAAHSTTVMHSDGLSARWSLSDYPGLDGHHPAIVAAALLRDFSRDRDDATVVVVRRLQ
jgi:anti-sigma regulatory factor (Ser/Thr protein kinase)